MNKEKNNKELSREEIRRVAERYGFEVEFNSPNPGVEFVRKDGTVKHYSVDEAADWVLQGKLKGELD
ncbi:hypothetical protein [Shouchella clausii]|uniref:hypothetical protein n=1 Tax=Shouchella clausii TaxID=79880 RepID=UPI001C7357C2|nr:hypothetical protein [Shouchella clausii]MBX0320102.1 hypothetical protein [Shouchella clausii]